MRDGDQEGEDDRRGPGQPTGWILEKAGDASVTLRLGGVRYRLDREHSIGVAPSAEDTWANSDPERA